MCLQKSCLHGKILGLGDWSDVLSLMSHIVMVHAEDEEEAEDSGPPGLETDESFSKK